MKANLFSKLAIRIWQILDDAIPENVPHKVRLDNKPFKKDGEKYYELNITLHVPRKQIWKLMWVLKPWRVK